MPSFTNAFRQEISRLSKKALKGDLVALQTSSAQQKRQISALKKQVAELSKVMARLQSGRVARPSQFTDGAAPKAARFSAKGFRSLRGRLGLTLGEMATLLGASSQSIYNWEHGKTKPRANQLTSIAEIRGLGKREAQRRLESSVSTD